MDPIIQSHSPSQSYGQFFFSSCSPLQINLNEATSSMSNSAHTHAAATTAACESHPQTLKALGIKLHGSTLARRHPL